MGIKVFYLKLLATGFQLQFCYENLLEYRPRPFFQELQLNQVKFGAENRKVFLDNYLRLGDDTHQ